MNEFEQKKKKKRYCFGPGGPRHQREVVALKCSSVLQLLFPSGPSGSLSLPCSHGLTLHKASGLQREMRAREIAIQLYIVRKLVTEKQEVALPYFLIHHSWRAEKGLNGSYTDSEMHHLELNNFIKCKRDK